MLRLLLDEDVRPLLGEVLRQRAYDVVHVVEAGRGGKSDAEQLSHATREGRVILTHNVRDYIALDREYRMNRKQHAGILVSDQLPIGELLRRTLRCVGRLSAEEVHARVVWLNDFK